MSTIDISKMDKSDAPTDNGIEELDSICRKYNAGQIDISNLVCTIWNKALDIGDHDSRQQARIVIANDTIREIIEDAHQAGQADAGVDPSYSNARAYCDRLFPAS